MFVAALFTTAKTQKQQPKCPWKDEWMKMWCVSMEYYSPIKKNKRVPFAATWMQLEIIILNKISQMRKTTTM